MTRQYGTMLKASLALPDALDHDGGQVTECLTASDKRTNGQVCQLKSDLRATALRPSGQHLCRVALVLATTWLCA